MSNEMVVRFCKRGEHRYHLQLPYNLTTSGAERSRISKSSWRAKELFIL